MHNRWFLSLLPWATTFSSYSLVETHWLTLISWALWDRAVPGSAKGQRQDCCWYVRPMVLKVWPSDQQCQLLVRNANSWPHSKAAVSEIVGCIRKSSAVCILTGFPGDSEAHPKSENYCVGWTAQRPVGLGPVSQGISHRGWDYLTSRCKDFGSCVKWEATVEGFEQRHDVIYRYF